MTDDYAALFDGPAEPLFPADTDWEGLAAVVHDITHPTPLAGQDGPPWVHHFPAPRVCGHCGKPAVGYADADGVRLCHTGTVPPDAEPPDCYRLVTVHGHAADGSCCRDGAIAAGR